MKMLYGLLPSILIVGTVLGSSLLQSGGKAQMPETPATATAVASGEMETQFDYLSTHGNSNCSSEFLNSIAAMPDTEMLQGSCCSPMVLTRYIEQRTALEKYQNIAEIPSDPYDIQAGLAKKLIAFDTTITPTAAEQRVLDDALAMTKEQGYCCCQCWRWYVYEGLSKDLVRNFQFSSDQVAEVLNNSDGCGGAS